MDHVRHAGITFIDVTLMVGLDRLFMKNELRLSLEDLVPVKNEITPGFRLKRWTVIGILSVTLWLTSPLHKFGAAPVSAVRLVLLPRAGILRGGAFLRKGPSSFHQKAA